MTTDSREFFVPVLRYLEKYRNEDVPGIILFAYISRNVINQYIIYGNQFNISPARLFRVISVKV